MKKNRDPQLEGYNLVPETAGKISNGVYISDDGERMIIKFAWGRSLHFKPIKVDDEGVRKEIKIKK